MSPRIALAGAIGLLSPCAQAATNVACVGNATELSGALSALSTSSTNSDADEIRIRVGTYSAPAAGFAGSITTHHNLTIRGGYLDAICTQQTQDSSRTVLDGNGNSTVLTIDTPLIPDSDVAISGVTFQNGNDTTPFGARAGALKIGDPGPISGGRVFVERNIFRNNTGASAQASGALLAATDGEALVVRGNLFAGNQSPNTSAAFLYSNNAIDFSNNTLSGNRSLDGTLATRVALGFFTFGGLKSSNNIFWGNATGSGDFDIDFNAAPTPASTRNDDIEHSTGVPAAASSGTLHTAPLFLGAGDFRLAFASPLIDAGVVDPDGGFDAADLDGASRVDGAAVDLGAFESNYVFVGNFD